MSLDAVALIISGAALLSSFACFCYRLGFAAGHLDASTPGLIDHEEPLRRGDIQIGNPYIDITEENE